MKVITTLCDFFTRFLDKKLAKPGFFSESKCRTNEKSMVFNLHKFEPPQLYGISMLKTMYYIDSRNRFSSSGANYVTTGKQRRTGLCFTNCC